jgi:LysR family transcriptional activator of glutamate synthase operon
VELRQLVYFDAVVRHGGFTRASAALRVAQPAVSAQVRRLERELGTSLLHRTTRRVALTAAGEVFLAHIRPVLDQLDGARAALALLAGQERPQLRVGATPLLGPLDLPSALAECRRRHPGLRLTLREALIGELLTALDNDELDVIVGPIHQDLSRRYVGSPLVPERIVLVVPPGSMRSSSLADYRDEPFACLVAGSGLHAILLAAAAAEGFEARIGFEADQPATVRALVSAGLGVALLAASTARAAGPPVDIVELRRPPEHPPLGVIRRSGAVDPPVATLALSLLRGSSGLPSDFDHYFGEVVPKGEPLGATSPK